MKTDIKLSNGNTLAVEIDDRKAERQAYVMELDADQKPIASTHFTLVKGYREAESNSQFEAMSEEAFEALKGLEKGNFILA